MEGATEITPPPVKPPTPESPKEKPIFKTTIVFGQGPVKALYLEEELNENQRKEWVNFKAKDENGKPDLLHNQEPEFRVIEGSAYLDELTEIKNRTDITEEERRQLLENKRQEFQKIGRLALNRWGRQNALAAGAMLMNGDTEQIILSGGKTMRDWMKSSLPTERINNWPSEAELMKDIIVARFGTEYLKKYGKSIEEMIKVEDASTNTLENLAYTINNNPDLLKEDGSIGLLGTDFHIKRIAVLSNLFSVYEADGGQIGSQAVLKNRAEGRLRYEKILKHMTDAENNDDLLLRNHQEQHWSKELDVDLAYWLGYFGHVRSPQVIQKIVGVLSQPQWVAQAEAEFAKVGLDFNDISRNDLTKMMEERPDEFNEFRAALVRHVKEFRAVPPIPPLEKK